MGGVATSSEGQENGFQFLVLYSLSSDSCLLLSGPVAGSILSPFKATPQRRPVVRIPVSSKHLATGAPAPGDSTRCCFCSLSLWFLLAVSKIWV